MTIKLPIHVVDSDTFAIGFGWLRKQIYGEGGLEVYVGFKIICFWTKPEDY